MTRTTAVLALALAAVASAAAAGTPARQCFRAEDIESWTVRWVIHHLINELARHSGHADIIRESIDGATLYELVAGIEGWEETEWVKPWKPAADVTGT